MNNQITNIKVLKRLKYLYDTKILLYGNPIPEKQLKKMRKIFDMEVD